MSEPTFTATDPATWPALLTIDEIAAIYRRKVEGVRKSVQSRTFVPAPKPRRSLHESLLWRKCDVVRDVEGTRGPLSLRQVG